MARKSKNQSNNNNNHNNHEEIEHGVKSFKINFLNPTQEMAWNICDRHEITFLLGAAGCGKTFLAMAFAVSEIIAKKRKRIILTRPIVEAGGENLGFLPGDYTSKVEPFMAPLMDCLGELTGYAGSFRDRINKYIEVSPIAYLRGRTLSDAICILDEAQNCTKQQLKLYLTRLGRNSKMIINGDPQQSDLRGKADLVDVVQRLSSIPEIGALHFGPETIVRNPLITKILEQLEQ